ncbi:MAG: DUF2207 domain-containing protein, partial [Candidatus Aminicenantes bacterium]|nr:DUF2207 domain-containing protein [Candidatus Aminicenantes bacterium]
MPKTWLCAACFSLLMLSVLLPARAEAAGKDYFFPEVAIAIHVERDGSFRVEERRSFAFSGSFSWAELFIPLRARRDGRSHDLRIEDFSVADEDGRPLRLESGRRGDRFEAKRFYSARDERRTFVIRYRVRGGIRSSSEISELYWQAIGDGWSKPTERAEVTVHLPEALPDPADMLVYGHGPLSGVAEIVDARTARFTATNLPGGQFLEIRVVWPAGLTDGAPAAGLTREAVKEEEARFVRETIERGRNAREAGARRKQTVRRWVYVWLAWLVAGPLIFLAFYIPQWKKTGKDHAIPGAGDYFREPPSSLAPVLVEHLRKEGGTTTPRAFTATIFDLARRGYLAVEDRRVVKTGLLGSRERTETALVLKSSEAQPGRGAPLLPLESDVLEFLFRRVGKSAGSETSLTVEELKAWLKRNPRIFQSWFRSWSQSIKSEGRARGFVEPESIRLRNVFLAVALPVGILTANIPLVLLAVILVPKLL